MTQLFKKIQQSLAETEVEADKVREQTFELRYKSAMGVTDSIERERLLRTLEKDMIQSQGLSALG